MTTLPPGWDDALRRFEENDPTLKKLMLTYLAGWVGGYDLKCEAESWCCRFTIPFRDSPGAHFFARLGNAVGRNTHLKYLYIAGLAGETPGVVDCTALLDGLKRNSSIKELALSKVSFSDPAVCDVFIKLGDGCSNFATSLKSIKLKGCYITGLVDGIPALQSTLRKCTSIEEFVFEGRSPDDNGRHFHELLSAIRYPQRLKKMMTPSIGHAGFEALAPLLQDPESNLRHLSLALNTEVDKNAVATVLGRSKSLEDVRLRLRTVLDDRDQFWSSLAQSLCDASTIDGTYFSNHTLRSISPFPPQDRRPGSVSSVTGWNDCTMDRKQVAVRKVLSYHPNIDMSPFFGWDLKVLPIVVGWLEKARMRRPDLAAHVVRSMNETVDEKKLNAIYQFLHAMPGALETAVEEKTAKCEEKAATKPKVTSKVTEKQKKEMRAQRFGKGKKGENTPKKGGQQRMRKGGELQKKSLKQKRQQKTAGHKRRESCSGGGKQGAAKKKRVDQPLLPKEEIEKRLARAARFGTTAGVDELKAQLRRHRFAT